MTGKQMCEAISKWLWERHSIKVDPETIWSASPTGELGHVFSLYEQARADGYGIDEGGVNDVKSGYG